MSSDDEWTIGLLGEFARYELLGAFVCVLLPRATERQLDFSMLYLCGEYGLECRASVVVVICIFCTAPCGSFGALVMLVATRVEKNKCEVMFCCCKCHSSVCCPQHAMCLEALRRLEL